MKCSILSMILIFACLCLGPVAGFYAGSYIQLRERFNYEQGLYAAVSDKTQPPPVGLALGRKPTR